MGYEARITLERIVGALRSSFNRNPNAYPSNAKFATTRVVTLRLKRIQRVLNLIEAEKKVVVDAGCGAGLNAVLMIICGASHVYTIDQDPNQWTSAKLLFEELDLSTQIDLIPEDILKVDLPAESVSAVYSFEFLEHVSDLCAYHNRIYQWLSSFGRVYGRTGANGANPLKRREFQKWYRNADRERYAGKRREIISQMVPNIMEADLDRIVENTRGLDLAGITGVVGLWQEYGILLVSRELAPRNPLTGSFEERLLKPKEIINILRASGFDAHLLRPDFRAIGVDSNVRRLLYRLLGGMLRIFHPASAVFAPWLEVLGIKR